MGTIERRRQTLVFDVLLVLDIVLCHAIILLYLLLFFLINIIYDVLSFKKIVLKNYMRHSFECFY